MAAIKGSHAILAGWTRQPHWFVNDADAKEYAIAIKNVARHYSIAATQKTIDIFAGIIAVANVEAPRIVMSMQLAQQARQPRQPQRGPAQVFQFHTSPNPATSAPPATPAETMASPVGGVEVPDISSDQGAIGGEPAA